MPRPGWYNDNSNRAFPFVEGSVGIPLASGPITNMINLPDHFVVDCGFVLGSESEYVEGEHFIYLYQVSRSGNVVQFDFRSTDPEMAAFGLKFTRNIATDTEYTLEYLDSDAPSDPVSISTSETPAECRDPFWSGYLITGDMDLIAEDIADGASITAAVSSTPAQGFVEPALIQSLAGAGSGVISLGLANTDRTRVIFDEDDACYPERPQWDFDTNCGTDSEGRRIPCTYELMVCWRVVLFVMNYYVLSTGMEAPCCSFGPVLVS